MHSGIIHADGSREIRYSKSMTLLLYTLEYALVLLSSFLQSRYQSENDQGHLRLFEKPPSPQLLSFFSHYHIYSTSSISTSILQGYKYIYYYTISLLFPTAYDPLLATKKHSVAYSLSDSPGALRILNGQLFVCLFPSFFLSFIHFFFVSIL